MKLFSFDSNADGFKVRSALIDGEPWFLLSDICAALGIGNPSRVRLMVHKDDIRAIADDTNTLRQTEGIRGRGNPLKNWVNESGLYTVVLRSEKPAAKRFQRWVTSEVLPALRKHGFYAIVPEPNEVVTARQTARITGQLGRIRTSVEALEKPAVNGWGTMGECLASLGIEMPETPAARLKLSRRIRGLAKERGIRPRHRWSVRQCRAAATWPRELVEAAASDLPPSEQGQLPI